MPQYRRAYQLGGYYFFTVVTHERRGILTSELARNCLRNAWKKVKTKYPFELIALCLLPDHIHCIWHLPENDSDYSRRWAALKAAFSHEYTKKGGSEGSMRASKSRKREKAV
ncbi:MAG: transposase [FCB group bacterium]|nr:transposase [FCB group bacterium]